MLFFILRRLGSLVLVVWLIVTITFILLSTIKGGPFDAERSFPPEVIENLRARYHLDASPLERYGTYVGGLLRFDFGPSFVYEGMTVNDIIAENWSASFTLGILSVLISMIVGVPIGVISALRQNQWVDHLSMLGAIICVSAPSFVLAALLIHLFVSKLQWVGLGWEGPQHAILPALSLSAFSLAYITRMTRASMLETLRSDYIRTARAKGLSMSQAVWRHALRNALLPVVTYLGPLVAAVVTGSFVIETFFGIPGLGRYFIKGIEGRDHGVVLGLAVLYSSLLVTMNTLVDIAYAWLDPRIDLKKI